MRVGFVADDLYPGFGGQAAATEGHIGALLALGHEVRALAGTWESPTEPKGVEVTRLPTWRPGKKQTQLVLPRRNEMLSLLDWADVVQINTPTPLALRTLHHARQKGVPGVMGFHTQEESATLHFGPSRPVVTAALRGWYGLLYRRPDCLVAPTTFAAELARRYTSRPVHVVSNGIGLPGPAPVEPVESLRRRLLGSGRFLLSFMGRLSDEKRPQDLLDVVSELAALRRDVHLAIAGDGPLLRRLGQQAKRRGLVNGVSFLGYVSGEKKESLLRASDLFVMPSPTELQSIATLEAMARGCAVAAARFSTSAVCGMVEEADCGFCYAPGRPDETARRIGELLDDPSKLEQLQQNARRAAKSHDVHRSGRRLEEIYHSLLEARFAESNTPERKVG